MTLTKTEFNLWLSAFLKSPVILTDGDSKDSSIIESLTAGQYLFPTYLARLVSSRIRKIDARDDIYDKIIKSLTTERLLKLFHFKHWLEAAKARRNATTKEIIDGELSAYKSKGIKMKAHLEVRTYSNCIFCIC